MIEWGPRVAETVWRAVVALRMWWSDGAGSMKVASLELVTARLAFGNAIEFLHPVVECAASFASEASERMIKFTRLCAPFSWPGAWQTCSRGDPDLSTMIPQLSAVVVSMVVVSFADSASFDRPDRQ